MHKSRILIAAALSLLLGLVPVHAQTDLTCLDLAPANASAEYFIGLGNAYLDQGSYALSITAYTCAVEGFPDYAPAYMSRGLAYAVQRNEVAAANDYNHALELDANLIAAYNNRGMLYFGQGNFGLAIADFTLAVTLDPAYAPGYHNRALVHAAEQNYELAVADLQQAIALDPAYPAPYASLGAVYSAMALASYEQYTSLAGPRLPNGTSGTIIDALAADRAGGTFSSWLAFLTPAQP